MLITQISPHKRNSKRLNVFIDGEFAFSLDKELLFRLNLKENQTLTPQQIDKILQESEFDKWFSRSLHFLSYRPRSKKEILDYLNKNKVGETLINMIMGKLTAQKLINDREFAKWLISQRQGRQARGIRAIKTELRQKGIEKEIIEQVLKDEINQESELENACKIVKVKLNKLKREIPQKKKEKLTAFLLRRGFDWDIINQVLQKLKLDH